MAINLQKGQKIDIGLSKITVGLGWDPNEGTGHDFDLDASAIMINSERKLLSDNHFIFYNKGTYFSALTVRIFGPNSRHPHVSLVEQPLFVIAHEITF